MQKLGQMIQEEVAHLRELLSILKLEEKSLSGGNRQEAQNYFTEVTLFNKKRYQLKRKRKEALQKVGLPLPLELTSLLDQIDSLDQTIRVQIQNNIQLKKKPPLPKNLQLQQLKKKKRLLLEEDVN